MTPPNWLSPHPPKCSCQRCTNRRLRQVQQTWHSKSRRPTTASRHSKPLKHSTPRRLRRRNHYKFRFPWPFIFIVFAGLITYAIIYSYDPDLISPEPPDATAIERFVATYTNQTRQDNGLRVLRLEDRISAIARAHSENMIVSGYSHDLDGKGPTDRALQAGYDCAAKLTDGSYSYGFSENIFLYPTDNVPTGYGTRDEAIAADLVTGWMNSPGHRQNILDATSRSFGVGIAVKGSSIYATQNFSPCR